MVEGTDHQARQGWNTPGRARPAAGLLTIRQTNMPGRRISREEAEAVMLRRRQGYSLCSIAAQTGLSWNTVERILRKYGVQTEIERLSIRQQEEAINGGPIIRCPICRHKVYGRCRACDLRKKLATHAFPREPDLRPDEPVPQRHEGIGLE